MSTVKEKVQLFGLLMILKTAYRFLLRPLVLKAIDDPNETWDNVVMEMLDRLFDYTEE